MEKSVRAFTIPQEEWYSNLVASEKSNIYVGLLYEDDEDGYINEKFEFIWNDIGIMFHAYNDSWDAFGEMQDLFELMSMIQAKKEEPTIHEFAEMLKNIGFKDATKRDKDLNAHERHRIDIHKKFHCLSCGKDFIVGEKLLEDCKKGYPICPYCGAREPEYVVGTLEEQLEELESDMGCLAIYIDAAAD